MDASMTTAATSVSPSPAESPDNITPDDEGETAFRWSDAATKNLIMVVEKNYQKLQSSASVKKKVSSIYIFCVTVNMEKTFTQSV